MMVINAAYKVLRDTTSRKRYDRKRGMTPTAASAAEKQTRPSAATARPEPDTGPVDSLASILSDLIKDIMENDGKNAVGDLLSSLDKWVSPKTNWNAFSHPKKVTSKFHCLMMHAIQLESAMSGANEAPRDSGWRLDQQGVQRAGPDGALGEGGAPVHEAIVPSSELGAVKNPQYHTSVNSEERARIVEKELQRLKRQRDTLSGG
jgi:curved DNA-binding protein CbpA